MIELFTFENYLLYCSLNNIKPSYYKSLKDFRSFVKRLMNTTD